MVKTIWLSSLWRLDLFLNLYKSLENLWYRVYFIWGRPRVNKLYKKYNCKYIEDEKKIEKKKIKFDLVLFWNWLDDLENIVNYCKNNGIKTLFLENWYLLNTIQIDNKWVNLKNSISQKTYEEVLNLKKKDCNLKIDQDKIVTNLKFNVSLKDYILWFFSYKTIKWVFVELLNKLYKFCKSKTLAKNSNIDLPDKYVFIPFQVHDDTQIRYYSPIIKKMTDILDFFYTDIKKVFPSYKIVIKEHPMDLCRIKYPVKELKNKYKDIIWLKWWNIDEIFDNADYVITINSSVWFQALSKCKKVLILWQALYSNNPFVEVVKDKDEFKQKLINLKNKQINCNEVKKYIEKISDLIFIKWWLNSFEKKTIKEIICRIEKELKN